MKPLCRMIMGVTGMLCGMLSCQSVPLAENLCAKLRVGMSEQDAEQGLRSWGKRHMWGSELSYVDGITPEENKRFLLRGVGQFFETIDPPGLFKTAPIGPGQTRWVRYKIEQRSIWAVGYRVDFLLLVFDAKANRLLGWGVAKDFPSGVRDLSDTWFFPRPMVSLERQENVP